MGERVAKRSAIGSGPPATGWLAMATRRPMILVAIGSVPLAAVDPARRFRQCVQLADNYAWLRAEEPDARGMVAGTIEPERLVVEPSRMRAEYSARQEAM